MSTALNPDTDFQFPPEPAPAVLDREGWNAAMAAIFAHLRTLLGREANYDAVINRLTTTALAVISASITEEIDAQRGRFQELAEDADELAAQIDQIFAGGVDASRVNVAAITGLTATKGQAAFAEIVAKLLSTAAQLKTLDDLVPTPVAADAGKALTVAPDGASFVLTLLDLYSANLMPRETILAASRRAFARADKGKWIVNQDTGNNAQTFAAAATLGDGWWCIFESGNAVNRTLDPNGSETIDGLTSFVSYPGEIRLIQCNGTAFRSLVLRPGVATFLTAANFIWPPGIIGADVDVDGGGGGGGGAHTAGNGAGCGGGGGGRDTDFVPAQTPGTQTLASPGAGGPGGIGYRAGASTAPTAGIDGGASSFGNFVGASGGRGGEFGPSDRGSGGAAGFSNDQWNSSGTAPGNLGVSGNSRNSEKGGASGGRGALGSSATSAPGGRSAYGGGGGGGGGSRAAIGYLASSGGNTGGTAGGAAGAAGPSAANPNGLPGANGSEGSGGGGGGAGNEAAAAASGGRGGHGGLGGGGGGGGGAASNTGSDGGDGGNGGAGRIIVRMR